MAGTDTFLIRGRGAPSISHRGNSFRVSFYNEKGKRRHRQFQDESIAMAFYQEKLSEHIGEDDLLFTTAERVQFARLKQWCLDAGLELGSVVTDLIRSGRRGVRFQSWKAAWEWYETDMLKRNVRPSYRASAESCIEPFINAFKEDPPANIRPDEILGYLVGTISADSSRKTARGRICTFIRTIGIDIKPGEIAWKDAKQDERTVEYWTVADVATLLYGIKPAYAVPLAIGFFGGIRPKGELPRLEWRDFDFHRRILTIRGEVDKNRRLFRLHHLSANFWGWAKYGKSISTGPRVLERTYDNMRKAVGKAISELGLPPWPHDCTRHSFGTHAYHRGLEWTIENMRHIAGADLYAGRYKGEVSDLEGKAYFGIWPRGEVSRKSG